jgi:N-acetylneuraminic acid mutarotase
MGIKVSNSRKKVRVNITVDKALLGQAKKKLGMFGGKLSTLFNAYLNDFVKIDRTSGAGREEMADKIKELENRVKRLEKK